MEERVQQVLSGDESIHVFISYVPVGNAVQKLQIWRKNGAEIEYLSSHRKAEDVGKDEAVLREYGFPEGQIHLRQGGEKYQDIVERAWPDILIEDDCESIGGEGEMTYTNLRPEHKESIVSIVVKEFGGIDHLPDNISSLASFND